MLVYMLLYIVTLCLRHRWLPWSVRFGSTRAFRMKRRFDKARTWWCAVEMKEYLVVLVLCLCSCLCLLSFCLRPCLCFCLMKENRWISSPATHGALWYLILFVLSLSVPVSASLSASLFFFSVFIFRVCLPKVVSLTTANADFKEGVQSFLEKRPAQFPPLERSTLVLFCCLKFF